MSGKKYIHLPSSGCSWVAPNPKIVKQESVIKRAYKHRWSESIFDFANWSAGWKTSFWSSEKDSEILCRKIGRKKSSEARENELSTAYSVDVGFSMCGALGFFSWTRSIDYGKHWLLFSNERKIRLFDWLPTCMHILVDEVLFIWLIYSQYERG